jgi:uncharacterized protein (DUF1684 family)
MKSKVKFVRIIFILAAILILQFGCQTKNGEETNSKPLDENYLTELSTERTFKDSSMRYGPHSPFNRDPKAEYAKLNYYEPDGEFIFTSKLYEYDTIDTVDVFGTRGELRRVIKLGYFELNYRNNEHKVNMYKAFGRDGTPYYSIWFTDKTTGKETYGVGRYLDFEKEVDPDHIYTIDFNRAYNPYCAYSAEFTCPIPREEDYIDFEIKAGEKNFH